MMLKEKWFDDIDTIQSNATCKLKAVVHSNRDYFEGCHGLNDEEYYQCEDMNTAVEVKGKPCLLLNADSIPAFNPSSRRGTSVRKRAVAASQWQSHVSLLETFSRAAAQAALLKSPAPIEGHRSAMVVPGSGAGYTPMEEVKPFPAESEPQPLEISDPLTVATPTVEELPPLEPEERSMSMTSLSAQPGSTGSSFGSLSRVSTDTLLAASVHSSPGMIPVNIVIPITNTPKHIRVTVPHNADTSGKPPNVIVFSESSVSAESVKNTLWSILHKHRYAFFEVTIFHSGHTEEDDGVRKRAVAASQWQSHVSLLETFSRAAAQAALLKSPAPIEGHSDNVPRSAMVVPGSGAGYTPMEEVKPFPAESEPQPLEISDPLTVATPTVEELPPLEPEERSMSMTSLSAQPGSTGSSFGSLSRVSTDTLLAASVHSRYD
ncbi:hypothetical protein J6590_023817 [Homalodisca vitripennis]|nr:hypothetical protein J6590_023817 [Homalodisca vitripennis]